MSRQELSSPLTLRLPVDVLGDVEKVAALSDRTRSWVIVRALRLYLAGEGADILNIGKGLAELDRGQSHDMDDVIAEVESIVRGKVA